MNNYLTSIAARILVAAPVVRPRLGGHFEPSSVSIANANSLPGNATKHLDVDEKRERNGIEAEPRDFRSPAAKSLEIAPQLDHPTTRAPDVKSEATIAPPVTNAIADPAPTSREPVQQILAESSRQNTPVERHPVENVIGVTENSEVRSEIRDEPPMQNWPTPRFEESADNPVRVQLPLAESNRPTPTSAVKPLIANDDKSIPPAIRPGKPQVERELETIIIREQASPEQARLKAPTAKPPATPVSSDRNENGDSKTPAVVVHSKIAPLIERTPEPLQTNRRAGQSQPTIHVTIGRVEVRAVQSSPTQTKSRTPTPVMNLDDYLMRRSQGNTR